MRSFCEKKCLKIFRTNLIAFYPKNKQKNNKQKKIIINVRFTITTAKMLSLFRLLALSTTKFYVKQNVSRFKNIVLRVNRIFTERRTILS